MNSKKIPRGVDFSNLNSGTSSASGISEINVGSSLLAKWVPLLCAGAAVGVSVLALKEIKNVRKELIILKKEQVSTSGSGKDELSSKIELMDEQLRKITTYLANQNKNNKNKNTIIKEAVKTKLDNVKIINSEPEPGDESEEEVEVEVTDDDEES